MFSDEEGGFFLKMRQPLDHTVSDDAQVMDDLVMEDMMEEDEEVKEGVAVGGMVLVRKTAEEKERERELVDRLV